MFDIRANRIALPEIISFRPLCILKLCKIARAPIVQQLMRDQRVTHAVEVTDVWENLQRHMSRGSYTFARYCTVACLYGLIVE